MESGKVFSSRFFCIKFITKIKFTAYKQKWIQGKYRDVPEAESLQSKDSLRAMVRSI